MSRLVRFAVPAVALLALIAVSAARAEDKPAVGKVTGVVKNAEGQAAADVRVRVVKPREEAPATQPSPQSTPMAQDAGQQPGAPGGGGGGGGGGRWGNWETVAETQSDAEGKFELADVPVGNYLLFAGGRGIGMARQEIEIKAGETLQVELTLRPRQRDGGQQTPGQI